MSKPLCWGILGTGNIAAKFADQLNKASRGELVASGSRHQSSADQFAQQVRAVDHGLVEPFLSPCGISLFPPGHDSLMGRQAGRNRISGFRGCTDSISTVT